MDGLKERDVAPREGFPAAKNDRLRRMSKGKFVFENAMGRAEEIAEAIEQGEIGLEESIKQFEEGMTLIRKCRKVLEDAEMRIQTLEASLSEENAPAEDE